jgi:hypothetical protein
MSDIDDFINIPMDLAESGDLIPAPIRKRGRPPKAKPAETTELAKKRGRPAGQKLNNNADVVPDATTDILIEDQAKDADKEEAALISSVPTPTLDADEAAFLEQFENPFDEKPATNLAEVEPEEQTYELPRRGRPAASTAKVVKPEVKKSKVAPKAAQVSAASVDSPKLAVFHDDRRVAKAKLSQVQEAWHGANRQKTRNLMMETFAAAAKEKFGVTKVFGSKQELEQLCVGIPTPSLPIEYILANDILPFALIMIAGSWGSCKTSLLFEFFRWVYEMQGLEFHIDVEHKFDGDFACSIMRAPTDVQPFISNRAHSTEEWQSMLTHYSNEVKKVLRGTKEAPGPGLTVPVAFGLDSLAAGLAEEIQDKVAAEGHAGRTFAVDALYNKNFINAFVPQMANWPFMLLIVNHLKTKTDDRGNEQTYTLGGGNVNFRETIEIHSSVWRSKFKNTQFEGIGVRLSCAKNSFGPTHRLVKTRFIWWYEEDESTGALKQNTIWDWDWTICNLLHEAEGIYKRRLQERGLAIKSKSPTADIECMGNVPALGMGKEEYLPWTEIGRMIHESPAICASIREALSIKIRPKLMNGISLDKIIDAKRKEAE